MLGIVGDLGSKKVIAWEISHEVNLVVLANEIREYLPTFSIIPFNSSGFTTPCYSEKKVYLYDDLGYVYVDLYRLDFLYYVSKLDFYREFKRAF